MSAGSDRQQRWLTVGRILGAQGVKGELRIKSFTEDPRALATLAPLQIGEAGPAIRLRHIRAAKGCDIFRAEGVDDRDAAERLRGKDLVLPRDSLPEPGTDSYYIADLVGLTALSPSGAPIGKVLAVEDYGSGEIVELLLDQPVPVFGKRVMLPFDRAFAPEVRTGEGVMVIDLDAWLAAQQDGERP